ncbi:MAG: deoxyribodipyrimidine photo-lyase [Inquilinus sp.]|nr:deoxyribodipyrimidine photo-lyase [Inquilinus sp.]
MVSTAAPTVVWFRQDLRLADNPALADAITAGGPVIPVFILDESEPRPPGAAGRWWLHHSLARLGASLAERGSRLVLRRGDSAAELDRLIDETCAGRLVWNRRYEPAAVDRDGKLKQTLRARGIEARSFNSALLVEPWQVKTGGGGPYKVYTPFWRATRERLGTEPPRPAAAPTTLETPDIWPASDRLEAWELLPTAPDWAGGMRQSWTPGEAGALDRLSRFLDDGLDRYGERRNRPDIDGTSALSPHLHWGEIGPRQIWHAVAARLESGALTGREAQAEKYQKELVWREFAYHLLYHFPRIVDRPLDTRFDGFPWRQDTGAAIAAWRRGMTGYPIVDAGMRQLWQTGWMHNRVRMIVASFLTKHLLVPWQEGEAWFWDTLVDADLASNAASWQWVAGCGADAAPFFRIFNPILQGERFDPDGAYVRRFVPELAALPTDYIHAPWQALDEVLSDAGVALGETYPEPIVDHPAARRRALAAFDAIKNDGAKTIPIPMTPSKKRATA